MRVALVNYAHAPEARTVDALLDAVPTLVDWAQGLRRAGAEVTVFQGFVRDQALIHDEVRYQLVAGPFAPYLSPWRMPRRLHRQLVAARPQAVHLNSLLYALQARDLRRRLPAAVPLVVQHHAEQPRRGRLGRRLQRWALAGVDGFLFTGRDAAAPWLDAGVLDAGRTVVEIAEGSSRFTPRERAAARARSGIGGDPALLWLGHLDANKDPLTVLDGVAPVLARRPGARLWMVYRQAPLEPAVRARLAAEPALERAVALLGPRPHDAIEDLLSSADLLLQGSRREGSGYALIEALACAVVPVVTDIPSFRFLTGGGRVGALWPAGDAAALTAALESVLARPLAAQRQAARQCFEATLSSPAIGRRALGAYRALAAARPRQPVRRGRA